MALVAHVLHTPMPLLYDYTVMELVEWAEAAVSMMEGLYPDGRD